MGDHFEICWATTYWFENQNRKWSMYVPTRVDQYRLTILTNTHTHLELWAPGAEWAFNTGFWRDKWTILGHKQHWWPSYWLLDKVTQLRHLLRLLFFPHSLGDPSLLDPSSLSIWFSKHVENFASWCGQNLPIHPQSHPAATRKKQSRSPPTFLRWSHIAWHLFAQR